MKKYSFVNVDNMTYTIAEKDGFITDVHLGKVMIDDANEGLTELIIKAADELREYFSGKRKEFTLPLKAEGTEFQMAVWNATLKVPYSETVTYKDIAKAIGNENAAQAVGNALNRNPIMIMIPCHRVLSVARDKFGFACGPDMKKYLLGIEGSEFLNCK